MQITAMPSKNGTLVAPPALLLKGLSYLFEGHNYRERDLQPIGSLPKWLQLPCLAIPKPGTKSFISVPRVV